MQKYNSGCKIRIADSGPANIANSDPANIADPTGSGADTLVMTR